MSIIFTDEVCEIICRRSFHLLKVLTMKGNPRHVKRLSDYNFRGSLSIHSLFGKKHKGEHTLSLRQIQGNINPEFLR